MNNRDELDYFGYVVVTNEYVLDFEKLKVQVLHSKEWCDANLEVLQELARAYWREEKRNFKNRYREYSLQNPVLGCEDCVYEDIIPDSSIKTPEGIAIKNWEKETVVKLLNNLPKNKREMIIDFYFGGMRYEAIARKYNTTRQNATYHIKKAEEMIRTYLMKHPSIINELFAA